MSVACQSKEILSATAANFLGLFLWLAFYINSRDQMSQRWEGMPLGHYCGDHSQSGLPGRLSCSSGAEARWDLDALRGAEAPLFHVISRHVTACNR